MDARALRTVRPQRGHRRKAVRGCPDAGADQRLLPGPDAATIRFPTPIPATEGVIKVNFVEFASIPDAGDRAGADGSAAR